MGIPMDNLDRMLREIMRETGWKQQKLAEIFHVSQATVSRWLTGSEPEGPRRDAIRKLHDEVTSPTSTSRGQFVPLKGKVGAGQEVYAIDDGGDEHVEAPAGAKPDTIAVEVSGQSMFPAYEEGTILYYSKLLPPDHMINKRAVVQLADGRIFVKTIRPGTGPNLFTLTSINAQYPDMIDEVVDWAAPIDWIKPRS